MTSFFNAVRRWMGGSGFHLPPWHSTTVHHSVDGVATDSDWIFKNTQVHALCSTTMDTIQINSLSGARFRVLVQDCNGSNITSADVSRCAYTVYELGDFRGRTPVTGHTDVSVPLTCFLDTPLTDEHSGTAYNFEHFIDVTEHRAFPAWNAEYMVVYSIYDVNGRKYVHEIPCRTV